MKNKGMTHGAIQVPINRGNRGQYTYFNLAVGYLENEILPLVLPRDLRIFTHSIAMARKPLL